MLSTLHLNIVSLELHHEELCSLLQNSDLTYSFIGITETGFKDKDKAKNASKIEGFKHFDCCTKSEKGGTRIYVSEEFEPIPREDLKMYKDHELESVSLELTCENLLFLVYINIQKWILMNSLSFIPTF